MSRPGIEHRAGEASQANAALSSPALSSPIWVKDCGHSAGPLVQAPEWVAASARAGLGWGFSFTNLGETRCSLSRGSLLDDTGER